MTEYVIRRLLYGLLVVFLVTVFVFLALRLIPGDVVRLQLADAPGVTEEQVDRLAAELGLNQPLFTQLGTFLADAVRGDFGQSFQDGEQVTTLIGERLPITLQLGAMAVLFGVLAGIPLGVLSAVRRNSWLDQSLRLVSVAGISIPNFWLGLLMVTYLALLFTWSPPLVYQGPTEDLSSNLVHLALPALALGTSTMASIARMLRSSLLEVLHSNFIRTVRAKGASELRVIGKHAMRNSVVPVFSILGLQVGHILGGTVILESIFGIPGMGMLIFESVQMRDYPVVLGCVVVYGAVFVLINLIVDVCYGVIDPRIRYART
ncbi:peptide/nickel transport system permease protein [Tamaricihabitans halophyticus]|uniref:Peptide/nickel transport system permease protein n=1 Tax=Tamaricihabitans halophyticus TaxID=1262583 RepID=A0A4R2QDU7_9PSEU|nr:ABC transporter permease [Tamaricihabitans halophyticus]TCP46809.1 peptide/nickel transport system permease protein [Tamaricihabitans halophyticus]